MKRITTILILFFSLSVINRAVAQVHVNVNVNIGDQPEWGPTGYERVDYYYLPDIETFYYVPRRQFIYMDGGRWIFAASLPERYGSYDLYRGYKVVVTEPAPYRNYNVYRERYGRYRNCYGQQVIIRDRRHGRGDDDDDQGEDHPGKHGRGHAYGHYKHQDHDD